GVIKKTAIKDFDNMHKGGIIALGLREDDELIGVQLTSGEDDIMIGTANGMSIRFHEDDVRPMGRTATGVRAIKLDDDDEVIDMTKVEKGCYVLAITERGLGKRTEECEYGTQGRGGKGVKTLKLTEKTGRLVCLRMCTDEEDIMLVRDDGVIIRVPAKDISIISRNTQGVKLMRVDDEHRVVSIARAPHNEEEAFEKAAHEHEAEAQSYPAAPRAEAETADELGFTEVEPEETEE
ncbi:MAG: DNA gyrase subunit A, partial [Clostridia bacterium]|nr:DNA gyrase subunit A [Clostridia bacterium]